MNSPPSETILPTTDECEHGKLATNNQEAGAVLIEFALALPFLMLMLFGVLDAGRMLNTYVLLSQAAHTGVRDAAMTHQLAEGTFEGLSATQSCTAPSAVDAAHRRVQISTEDALRENSDGKITSLCILSSRSAGVIRVRIQARFQNWLPLFADATLSSEASGLYLLREPLP